MRHFVILLLLSGCACLPAGTNREQGSCSVPPVDMGFPFLA